MQYFSELPTFKAAAPKAEEQISYGMPYYGYKGRLAYFAYAKHHIGLYAMPPIVKDHAKELRKVGIRLTQVAPTGCGLALVFGEGG